MRDGQVYVTSHDGLFNLSSYFHRGNGANRNVLLIIEHGGPGFGSRNSNFQEEVDYAKKFSEQMGGASVLIRDQRGAGFSYPSSINKETGYDENAPLPKFTRR